MKRFFCLCFLVCVLSGCGQVSPLSEPLSLRDRLLKAQLCSFAMEVTADYGSQIHQFTLDCQADARGNLSFTVVEPESISGITGQISASGGRLTFDDTVLGFPLLAEETLSPVSTPWVFLNSLRSGYMTSCAKEQDGLRLTVNDSYAEDALQLDVWMRQDCTPYYGEILWHGRRILSFAVEDFKIS